MNERVADLVNRANRALKTAEINDAEGDYDAAASRAHYAAFYEVSAVLAREGKRFKKHSAVEVALHRDLIRTGRLPESVGKDYATLYSFKTTGDYGDLEHVTAEQASEAVEVARRVLAAVALLIPS
jgi:uncharacterized protein (UPF0332 family)